MEQTTFRRREGRHIRIILHRRLALTLRALTGVDTATHVVAATQRQSYMRLALRGAPLHVPMVAAALDEPPCDSTHVNMLEVLSGTEADFCSHERSVLGLGRQVYAKFQGGRVVLWFWSPHAE
jgi:hypothetical protein